LIKRGENCFLNIIHPKTEKIVEVSTKLKNIV